MGISCVELPSEEMYVFIIKNSVKEHYAVQEHNCMES